MKEKLSFNLIDKGGTEGPMTKMNENRSHFLKLPLSLCNYSSSYTLIVNTDCVNLNEC